MQTFWFSPAQKILLVGDLFREENDLLRPEILVAVFFRVALLPHFIASQGPEYHV